MEQNVFLVRWYGPFKGEYAKDELRQWEKSHPEYECNLYLIR